MAFDFAGGSCCKVRAEDPELGPVRTSSVGPGWVGVGIAFECDGEQKSQRPPALAGPSDPGCVGGVARTLLQMQAHVCAPCSPHQPGLGHVRDKEGDWGKSHSLTRIIN